MACLYLEESVFETARSNYEMLSKRSNSLVSTCIFRNVVEYIDSLIVYKEVFSDVVVCEDKRYKG
jgi:hypothetical protein